jgi:hypothetical protein
MLLSVAKLADCHPSFLTILQLFKTPYMINPYLCFLLYILLYLQLGYQQIDRTLLWMSESAVLSTAILCLPQHFALLCTLSNSNETLPCT